MLDQPRAEVKIPSKVPTGLCARALKRDLKNGGADDFNGCSRAIPVDRTHHAFAYVFDGSGGFRDASNPRGIVNELTNQRDAAGNRSLVLFGRGAGTFIK
jgi:hypothetical protein